MLAGETDTIRSDEDYLAWEIFGNRAVRQGRWKLRWQWKPFGKEEWELFDLVADPGERLDLAAEEPVQLAGLIGLWNRYVEENNVVLPSRSVFESLDDSLPQRVPDDPGYPPMIQKRQFIPPAEMVKGADQ